MSGLSIFLVGILAWASIGALWRWLDHWHARIGSPPLRRSLGRGMCRVGELVQVNLHCDFKAVVDSSQEIPPWDLLLLLDRSGSMGEGRGSAFEEAKDASINLVMTTPGSFRFAILTFDHGYCLISSISDHKRALARALRQMKGGTGGTNIAAGLAGVREHLQSSTGELERKRAISLVSDGCDQESAAIALADQLKQSGIEIFTLAVGNANNILLSKIANGPEWHYTASSIEQIKPFYEHLGRVIQAPVCAVEVSEKVNIGPALGVRGWGEIKPVRIRMAQGELTWMVGTVPHEGTTLSYLVTPHCPGWHPIVSAPAQATATVPGGKTQTFRSRRSPRVLVMPRFSNPFMSWLIFNPLYFALFGRFHCSRSDQLPVERKTPIQVYFPPAPLPVPLRRSEQKRHRAIPPTLVIGLGFGGIHATLWCKYLLEERDEEPDWLRNARFCGVDTAGAEFFPAPTLGLSHMEEEEILRLESPLEPLLTQEAETDQPRYQWLHARKLLAEGVRPDGRHGLGQSRALGRLAILENIAHLEAFLVPHLQALSNGEAIRILVTATTAGGTSSGGLMDFCWLLRKVSEEQRLGTTSISLFLIPPFACEQQFPQNNDDLATRWCNHQALVREMERIAAHREIPRAPEPHLPALPRWFDRLFLVGPLFHLGDDSIRNASAKCGEAMLCWMASGEFHDHFVASDREVYQMTEQYHRLFGHVIDLQSLYLHVRSVRQLVFARSILEGVRTFLYGNEYAHGNDLSYLLSWHHATEVINHLSAMTDKIAVLDDAPWCMVHMKLLVDGDKLLELIRIGGGPTITSHVDILERDEYLRSQYESMARLVDQWLVDSLNNLVTGPDGLRHVIQVLQTLFLLRDYSKEGIQVATDLANREKDLLVSDECGLIRELLLHVDAICSAWIPVILDWILLLGEGNRVGASRALGEEPFLGVVANLVNRIQKLEQHLQALCSPSWTVSRFPSSESDFKGLVADHAYETVFGRLRWEVERTEGRTMVCRLIVMGVEKRVFEPGREPSTNLVLSLVEALMEICAGSEKKETIITMPKDVDLSSTFPRLEPPYLQGAPGSGKAEYLKQGTVFQGDEACPVVPISGIDETEARICSVARNSAIGIVWNNVQCMDRANLPFVHAEEYWAWRAYELFCREGEREPQALPMVVVAVAYSPKALLSFALNGLANNKIVKQVASGRASWVGLTSTGQHVFLTEATDNAVNDFVLAGLGWGTESELISMEISGGEDHDPADAFERISRHELVFRLGDDETTKFFLDTVRGMSLIEV